MATPALLRVVERQAVVSLRLWRGSIGFALMNPLFFLAAMGLGLGALVDRRSGGAGGLPYLVFVAPGVMAGNAVQVVAGESMWYVQAGFKWMGSFRAMVATPLRPGDVYGGVVAATALRSGVAATAFLVVAALLGAVPSAWGVLAVPAVVLCALAFAAPITAFTATQETDLWFPVVMRLLIVPLFLLSGTFFPVADLPPAVRGLTALSPLWHGVELCRAATTGSTGAWAPALHVAVLVAVTAAGWLWGTRTFAGRLTP